MGMNEYTIKAVASKAKPWMSKYGKEKNLTQDDMVTYLIQLEGNGEPVQLNKKSTSERPQVGDKLFGKVEEVSFGDSTIQKFKAAQKPHGGYQRDDNAIRAQWAIGQAVQMQIAKLNTTNIGDEPEDIENNAKILYAMVDRVKGSNETPTNN